jgi:hypothetical protein
MKKFILIIVAAFVFLPGQLFAWAQRGHDAVAYIAELNLKPSAKKKIEQILGNHSIVYYSVWMDTNKQKPGYEVLKDCHTAYVDDVTKQHFVSKYKPTGGDAVTMVEDCWKRLKDYHNQPDSVVVVNLYALIHILGDMHCPGHVYYESMRPKLNKFPVTFMGTKTTLHGVWDGGLVDRAHSGWFYTEWAHQLNRLSKKEIKEITAGTPAEWFHRTAVDTHMIYDKGVPGAKLGRDYINEMLPMAERQIQIAGYRLAHILNDIFG